MAAYLTPWRWAAALVLLALVGVPLVWPVVDLALQGSSGWTADDSQRLVHLFQNTTLLIAGALALAMPAGILLAIVLFRTEFPGRRVLLCCIVVMLFVPLPMITSAWQAMFGSDGWIRLTWWGDNAGRVWTSGLAPAIWVHAWAGLPWVVVFVGLGLTWVEREYEEFGLLQGPPWWVLLRLTLPRCRGIIFFAAAWLALQVAGEITVTDMMLVSTFAEEVQTQFTAGDRGGVARSVVSALPLVLVTGGLLAWYMPRLEHALPPLQMRLAPPRRFDWGAWSWPVAVIAACSVAALFGLPLASLLWKLGQAGHPVHWSWHDALNHGRSGMVLHGGVVAKNLLLAGAVAAVVASFAVMLCWLADESTWFRRLVMLVLALAWALPAPIIGIGLKETIALLPDGLLADLFYHGPSPLPLAWAYVVRFLPFAVAVLWPVVRLVPREPREAARLEGQGPWREFWTITWPLTRHSVLYCGVLVAALCLGEVAASTRVETPGWEGFSKLLFDRMHYGVTNDVAALCLLLLAAIVIVLAAGFAVRWLACPRRYPSL